MGEFYDIQFNFTSWPLWRKLYDWALLQNQKFSIIQIEKWEKSFVYIKVKFEYKENVSRGQSRHQWYSNFAGYIFPCDHSSLLWEGSLRDNFDESLETWSVVESQVVGFFLGYRFLNPEGLAYVFLFFGGGGGVCLPFSLSTVFYLRMYRKSIAKPDFSWFPSQGN